MTESLRGMGTHLVENAELLAGQIVEIVLTNMRLNISDTEFSQAAHMYTVLFKHLGETFLIESSQEEVPGVLLEWSKENAVRQITSSGKISEIIIRYTPTRAVLINMVTEISIDLNLSLRENAHVIKRLNQFLDVSLNETISYYEELTEQYKFNAEKEIAELSAPIVPIKEGIAVIPLVGTFTPARIAHLKDNVVPKIAEMNIRNLIVDYSGVESLSFEFGQSLYELAMVLQLLDVNVIATGLSPKLSSKYYK